MARMLTKKQMGFVIAKAEGKTGVQAALENYDTDDYHTANAIAVENLQKPAILEELKKLGFDTNNAKRVVGEILNNEYAEEKDRLKAADLIFKVQGDFAPEKHVNVNVEVEATPELQEAARILDEHFKRAGVPGDGTQTSAVGDEAPHQE